MRTKHTFRLPPDLAGKLADYAARNRVPQALVVENPTRGLDIRATEAVRARLRAARAAGLAVVMDRCVKIEIEHARLSAAPTGLG